MGRDRALAAACLGVLLGAGHAATSGGAALGGIAGDRGLLV